MTTEKYAGQVVKRLKCSGKKKEEIRRQLISDIEAELESGETFADIMNRMGKPREFAREFNQNMPESEHKRYVRRRGAKICFTVVFILIILVFGIYLFLPKTKEIAGSDMFDTESVEEQAKEIVLLLNAEDYDALKENAVTEMQPVLNQESMGGAREQIAEDCGEFRQFGNVYMAEVEQQGKSYAVVELTAAYENTNITYTISFDENMKLAGLYMK